MQIEDYRTSFSVVTSNNAFFELLKAPNVFDAHAEKCTQPHNGKRLETYYEGNSLPEVTEVVKKFHEAAKSFIAAGGKKYTKKQGELYYGRLHIRETKPFPGSFLRDTKAIKGFPGIVPTSLYIQGIGSIEYQELCIDDRGAGHCYRGFTLRMSSYLIESYEKGSTELLSSPKIVARVIRYFRQSWG